jgi:hypothetical protein
MPNAVRQMVATDEYCGESTLPHHSIQVTTTRMDDSAKGTTGWANPWVKPEDVAQP